MISEKIKRRKKLKAKTSILLVSLHEEFKKMCGLLKAIGLFSRSIN